MEEENLSYNPANSNVKPDLNLNSKPISTSDSLYRTKLMVVGYENVGKTTILDCLFPIQDLAETKGTLMRTEYLIELWGKYLRKYQPKELNKIHKEIILEDREWNIEKLKETGLELVPLNDKNQRKIEIYLKDQETRDKWFGRLKRVILNVATHGIEIQEQILQNQTKSNNIDGLLNNVQQSLTPNIDVSIWDFAGHAEYYNTHHYFLSNRSIFLVLYRMDKGIKGLESLDFWFKSLSFHLNQNYCDENGKPFYSIIIVGTFLDDQNVDKLEVSKKSREQKILEMYDKNGLKSPPFYFEVSCSTLENIEELKQKIYSTALNHSYMGQKLPIGYLKIKNSIEELRNQEKFKNFPIISLQELINYNKTNSEIEFDDEFVKKVLKLLPL